MNVIHLLFFTLSHSCILHSLCLHIKVPCGASTTCSILALNTERLKSEVLVVIRQQQNVKTTASKVNSRKRNIILTSNTQNAFVMRNT